MSSDLQITVSQEQGRVPVTVFHIAGEIGSHNRAQLQEQARVSIESGTRYLLLDLTQLVFMSSAGLRAMHAIYNMLREASEEDDESVSRFLKLMGPSADILRLIQTIGFEQFVEIHDSLEAAVASF